MAYYVKTENQWENVETMCMEHFMKADASAEMPALQDEGEKQAGSMRKKSVTFALSEEIRYFEPEAAISETTSSSPSMWERIPAIAPLTLPRWESNFFLSEHSRALLEEVGMECVDVVRKARGEYHELAKELGDGMREKISVAMRTSA